MRRAGVPGWEENLGIRVLSSLLCAMTRYTFHSCLAMAIM
nr:MAG TPA: hypothetical protein [Caudoviricetes sp.]